MNGISEEGFCLSERDLPWKVNGAALSLPQEIFMKPGYVVNAAGLYADRVAQDFDFSEDYRILLSKALSLLRKNGLGLYGTNIIRCGFAKSFFGVQFYAARGWPGEDSDPPRFQRFGASSTEA